MGPEMLQRLGFQGFYVVPDIGIGTPPKFEYAAVQHSTQLPWRLKDKSSCGWFEIREVQLGPLTDIQFQDLRHANKVP